MKKPLHNDKTLTGRWKIYMPNKMVSTHIKQKLIGLGEKLTNLYRNGRLKHCSIIKRKSSQ